MKTEAMEDYEKLIGEGNDAFKDRYYEETLAKLWMTTAAHEISQNYQKALSRMCQAFEALDKVEQAYSDAKAVHNKDPKNKAI